MANDTAQKVTIEPGQWGADAVHWLSQARGHSSIEELQEQSTRGAALFYVKSEGKTVGAWILRIDETATGAEGVIVAAAAKLEGVDMIALCMADIENRFKGCRSIRYHTAIPALARKLARRGYVAREIVCVKNLDKTK